MRNSVGHLIVSHKTWCAHEAGAVFDAQISGDPDVKGADVFDRSRVIDETQFDCAEDEVFIARANTSAETKVRLVIKDATVVFGDHCHLAKSKRCEPEAKELPGGKSNSFALDVEALCTPQTICAKVLEPEFMIYVQWQRVALPENTRVIHSK